MSEEIRSAVGIARAKPDRAAELGALLAGLAERSRSEPGCLQSTIHRNPADPVEFVFYESWQSDADLARHLDQPYMREFRAGRMDYLSQDLDVRQLTPVELAPADDAGADPAAMNQRYLDAYNARDLDAIMAVYAPGAAAVWEPGKTVTGPAHRAAVADFLKRDPRLSAEVRDCYVAGDTATLVIDWQLEVPGSPEMTGTGRGLDVLRRGPDGRWRYLITNPFGSL